MSDFVQGVGAAIRIAIVVGGSGAVFALCVVVICRWLKWAPINITVNVNNNGPIDGSYQPSPQVTEGGQ